VAFHEATTSEHPIEEPDTRDEVAPFPEVAGYSDVIESVRDAEPLLGTIAGVVDVVDNTTLGE
jgi:hypothetical protein